jgi:hypothetical protein
MNPAGKLKQKRINPDKIITMLFKSLRSANAIINFLILKNGMNPVKSRDRGANNTIYFNE